MTLQQTTDRESLLERELARSESERARAEAHNERLRRDAQANVRVETELRLELERTRAAQVDAQQSIQMALAEVNAMREIWTHAHGQLDLERRRRFALHAELDLALLEVAQLAERLAANSQPIVAAASSWRSKRAVRVAIRFVRAVQARLG